jgi:DNA repair protein RecO (recombination protein O)
MPRYFETNGYIIHLRDYQDSSMIIEFFSEEQGKIQLIAKGIKKNKLLKSQVQYFNRLTIQYYGKSSLKTLSSINILHIHNYPNIIEKTAGMYLNELLHYCLHENDSTLSVYQNYEYVLEHLGEYPLGFLLRQFEKEIIKYCGFELSVDKNCHPESWLSFDASKGLIETHKESEKICQVKDITAFIHKQKLSRASQIRINSLMIKLVNLSVNSRRLYSREMLIDLIKLE